MKTIGSHPGAILFRMSIMVILIAILVVVFFSYVSKVRDVTERAAISRTKGIIDSSLAIVFATYAAQAKLDKINNLDGANPFEALREYSLLPSTYMGEIDHELNDQMSPGWYYLVHRRQVEYKSRYLGSNFKFELVLNYDDVNQSGRFDPEFDVFNGLYFRQIGSQDRPQ